MARDVRASAATEAVTDGALRRPRARYLPIAEHGLIGDLHTVALVGTDGTIDWYCCPRFDAPSVFGAILDADRGGAFRISPDYDGWSSKQLQVRQPDHPSVVASHPSCRQHAPVIAAYESGVLVHGSDRS